MLYETYVRLLYDFPEGCGQLFGEPVSSDGSLWISVDGDEYPSLLFRAQQNDIRSDIELRSVSAWFSRNCVIEAADGQIISGVYTVIRLNDSDPDVVRILLRLLEETFPAEQAPYANKDIAAQVLELSHLLRQIANSDMDMIGLWGELYIISQAANTAHAVRCWCMHKMAKYDFVTRNFVLEIKTTLRSRRKHSFSLGQLRPTSDFAVYIASLAVVELNSGRTASELMDDIYDNIVDDELRISFLRQCLLKGGQDIYRSTLKLDAYPDRTSLAIFDASTLPVPQLGEADPIDNVCFDLDLTDLPCVSLKEIPLSFDIDTDSTFARPDFGSQIDR